MIVSPRNFALIVSIFLCSASNAQLTNYHYSVAYFGNNLWNEGLNLGIEKLRDDSTKTTKRGKTRQIQKSYAANIGFYNDTKSHLGLFVGAGWSKRKIFQNRFNFTTTAQPIGLYRSFLPETYKVKDNGEVKKVFLPGRFYLAPSVSAGIGRMGRWNEDNGWYTRVNVMTLFPYSRAIVPLINVEFGYHFAIKPKVK
jgi:hypothetical protein